MTGDTDSYVKAAVNHGGFLIFKCERCELTVVLTLLESKDGLEFIHLILVCSERQYIFNLLSFEILNYKPVITPMGYCLEITAKENPLPQHSFYILKDFLCKNVLRRNQA